MPSPQGKRDFDILVIGATGYTGKLVVQALKSTTWTYALAGRNFEKLQRVAESVSPGVPPANLVVVDTTKKADVEAAVSRARLVIACAGPFSLVGMSVVDACVAAGTHYVDITGEVPFIRSLVEKHHTAAAEKGIFVVPCCGFDCVAADMANHYTHRLAEGRGKRVSAIESGFAMKGGMSRGTLESSMHFVQTATKADLHPLCLIPSVDRKTVKLPSALSGVAFHDGFRSYRGPFVMTVINERVVRRSDYLAARNSTYSEMLLGTWKQCKQADWSQGLFIAMKYSLGRELLRRYVFPPEGDGPSEAERAKSSFKVNVLGRNPEGKIVVASSMSYQRDAYTFTGVSAVEVASSILNDEINSNAKAGVVTPAYVVGDALIRRLGDKGVRFRSKI